MTGPTTADGLRIGSLFSGYEGLGMAVQQAIGGDIAWVSDIDAGACKILAHRYPQVPNIGDITAVDWAAVEPVDILTGGFPCQDVSAAGKRLGMKPGTRSGLWSHMAYAIDQLRPSLVVAENVRGLLSASAHSDLEPCPWCVGDGEGSPLRALGGVLGDLAGLGYDASWQGLRASDVGAPHGRFRVFVIAWPAADADRLGHERGRGARDGRTGPADRRVGAADSSGYPRGLRDGDGGPAADAVCLGGERRGGHGDLAGPTRAGEGREGERERDGDAADHRGAAARGGDDLDAVPAEGRSREDLRGLRGSAGEEAVRQRSPRGQVGFPASEKLLAVLREQQDGSNEGRSPLARSTPSGGGLRDVPGDDTTARAPRRPEPGEQRSVEPADALRVVPPSAALVRGPREADGRCQASGGYGCSSWGQYAPAIHRWEVLLGRLAPPPTERTTKGAYRLSAAAVEFMMGLPAGHVTQVPGLTRNEQLKALGNGVVPQQAAEALRLLLPDVGAVAA